MTEMMDSKKKIDAVKNINLHVIQRILLSICEDSPSKITNLSMRSGLNHRACKKYVNLMTKLNWLETKNHQESTLIYLTSSGRAFLERLNKEHFNDCGRSNTYP